MSPSKQPDYIVDYLVVGAGFSGLGFVDIIISRTPATVLIVDKRALPGGHWVDAYPYVKLHQPANQYGVSSKELSSGRVDVSTLNKGFLDLSSGSEVQAYAYTLMRDQFIASGRVTWLPSTEYLENGTLRGVLSGKVSTVQINRRLVDAGYFTNDIPMTHARCYSVTEGVTCIPPNYLPGMAKDFAHYAVLGAGKTGADACLWLLTQGVEPHRIRWVIPNDYWYFNRAFLQGTEEMFVHNVSGIAAMLEVFATAKSARDFGIKQEEAGVWLRLDPNVTPRQYHAAVMSEREIQEVRRLKDIVRQGYVTKIEPQQITFTNGTLAATPDTLYVDCTASILPDKPSVPVFQPGKIVMQMVRYTRLSLSAARIGLLESLPLDDTQRNFHATPMQYAKSIEDFVHEYKIELETRIREAQMPALREHAATGRLDPFTSMIAHLKPEETEKIAAAQRLLAASVAAHEKIGALIASFDSQPAL